MINHQSSFSEERKTYTNFDPFRPFAPRHFSFLAFDSRLENIVSRFKPNYAPSHIPAHTSCARIKVRLINSNFAPPPPPPLPPITSLQIVEYTQPPMFQRFPLRLRCILFTYLFIYLFTRFLLPFPSKNNR